MAGGPWRSPPPGRVRPRPVDTRSLLGFLRHRQVDVPPTAGLLKFVFSLHPLSLVQCPSPSNSARTSLLSPNLRATSSATWSKIPPAAREAAPFALCTPLGLLLVLPCAESTRPRASALDSPPSGAARPGLPTAAPLFTLRSVLGDAPRPVPFARRSPFVFLHRPGLCLESPHLFARSADEGPSRRTVGLPRAFPVFLSPDTRTQNSAWTCLVPRERPANELSDLNAISPTAGREMASPSVAFLAGIRPVGFCAYFLPNDLDYASRERPKGHDVKEKASRGTRGEGPGCARPDPARRAGGQAGGPAGASASLGRPLVRPRLLVNARDAGARTAAAGAWRRGRRRGLWC